MSQRIQFDWSQGRAFVQEGTIFYSPNCFRTVLVPARTSTHNPFERDRLDASLFKQPVWWTDVYGWQCFIPLAPLYTSLPFEPFCWLPRIIEVNVLIDPKSMSGIRERRYKMHPDNCSTWLKREQLLIEAAEQIRIWFKIPGNLPPAPSHFHYNRAHKTRGIAKKMVSLARDWFAVWMGLVSYLIACTKRYAPSSSLSYSHLPSNSPIPVWYHRLQEGHSYPAAWLDGLTASTVCTFDAKTPRAGVMFEWSKTDQTRPPLEWFLEHNIPVWFVWSREEEEFLSRDRAYEFLKPPNDLIQDALTRLFANPTMRIPLAGLIVERYYNTGSDPIMNETVNLLKYKDAPSFVLKYTTGIFISQEVALARVDSHTETSLNAVLAAKRTEQCSASQADAALPTQTMIEGVNERGRLFNHWREFLFNRKKRQEEIIRVETLKDRQIRMSCKRKPGIKNTDIYTWEKIQSSGGKDVYMHLRVHKKSNQHVLASFKKHQRLYNSILNEWDLCREFDSDTIHGNTSSDSDGSNLDDEYDWLRDQHTDDDVGSVDLESSSLRGGQEWYPSEGDSISNVCDSAAPCNQPYTHPHSHDHETVSSHPQPYTPPHHLTALPDARSTSPPRTDAMDFTEDDEVITMSTHYSCDVVEFLKYGYGYVPSINASTTYDVSDEDWEHLLITLGFVSPFSDLHVETYEKWPVLDFYNGILKKLKLPKAANDLDSNNHAALRHLFDFAAIHRPSDDLFVFSGPRSMASDWLLGINHPEIALYICRYILSNPGAHTVVTVANRLLDRGVPFRTLVGQSYSVRYTTKSEPYNPSSFRLANHIFTTQDFDAYMLRCQHILSQPQGRAALLQGGIVWHIAKEFLSTDGILVGPSVEVTLHRVGYMQPSGTPGIQYCDDELTGNEIALICGTYSLYTTSGQITVKSWFPPPVGLKIAWELTGLNGLNAMSNFLAT